MPLPSRSAASSFNALGKADSQNLPPANSTGPGNTDWQNVPLSQAIGDVAALGLTATRFWARITLNSTTGTLSLLNWWALWSNATTTTPVLARTGTGVFTVTLPTTVSDEIDAFNGTTNNITTNLLAASASVEGSSPGLVNASASGNVITLNSFTVTGSPNDLDGYVAFVRAF